MLISSRGHLKTKNIIQYLISQNVLWVHSIGEAYTMYNGFNTSIHFQLPYFSLLTFHIIFSFFPLHLFNTHFILYFYNGSVTKKKTFTMVLFKKIQHSTPTTFNSYFCFLKHNNYVLISNWKLNKINFNNIYFKSLY